MVYNISDIHARFHSFPVVILPTRWGFDLSRSQWFFVLVSLTLAAAASMTQAQSLQRQVPVKSEVLAGQTAAPSGRIVIKFTEESALTVHPEGLQGPDRAALARIQGLISAKSQGATLERRFSQDYRELDDLRRAGQNKTRRALPNLNAYGMLDFSDRGLSRTALLDVVKNLLADPAVETAFLEPMAVPAALGFDAFTGDFTAPPPQDDPDQQLLQTAAKSENRDSPDYTIYQGYLLAPPGGVNALAVNDLPGARGQNMKMIDVELGWNFNHEDLPSPFFTAGNITSTLDNRNHGTAVMGEIRGSDNGFGVRGITPEAQVGASSAYFTSVASALMTAWQGLDEGDVILIELHAPGPAADGNGQFGYVPMEYWQDNFDTIMVITAAGGVVVEAAGNGTQNLDDPIYGVLFDRNYRDSGAIMCGATTIGGTPYDWSNNGSRVDLNGWGGSVGTCGYGDLQDTEENVFYTRYFSGTSSASPIVTGSVMALQGLAKANYGFILDALTIRTLLAETGTPQQPGGIVGPRPDILAAFQDLEWGLGEISGTVTDAISGLPVEGAEVVIAGEDQSMVTDVEGRYQFVTAAGTRDLVFNQFFYQEASGSSTVEFGNPAVLDIALMPLPTVDVRAVVRTESGLPLTTARATALGVPLTSVVLPGNEGFLLAGAPIGVPLQLRFDREPFHGVDIVAMTPAASPTGYNFVYPELAIADFDFELWWYNFNSYNGSWVWGTPTGFPAAFSGEKCWAVGLDGDYPGNTIDYLMAPAVNLYGNEETYITLHYWSDLEDGIDGVSMQIKSYNNTWVDIDPIGGYSHTSIQALGGKPGWSGHSEGWQGAVFDVQPFTDLPIEYRLKFASDNAVQGAGFFIDDVTYDTGNSVSAVDDGQDTPAVVRASVSARPNPFNPRTTIQWSITRPGPMTVKVFDTRGRLVRTLASESVTTTSGSLVWDGMNERGAGAASGTYLVQVKDSAGQGSTRRVTLLK